MYDVTFSSDGGGFGDLCASFWLAEGLRLEGKTVGYVCSDHLRRDVIERAGFAWEGAEPAKAIPLGSRFPPYHVELRSGRGHTPRLRQWGRHLANHACVPVRPTLKFHDGELARTREQLGRDLGDRPWVMLFPFADYGPRVWPMAYWLDLAWELRKKGYGVASFVPADRSDQAKALPFVYWGQSWVFLAMCAAVVRVVVGNDSGPTWLSGLVGVTPTLAMMGPTSNIFTLCPNVEEMRATKARVACDGCHFAGDSGYRAACDVQCRALMHLTPDLPYNRIVQIIEGAP